jgi:hypothetical protein
MPRLLKTMEAARQLGITRADVALLVEKACLDTRTINGKTLITQDSIDAFCRPGAVTEALAVADIDPTKKFQARQDEILRQYRASLQG